MTRFIHSCILALGLAACFLAAVSTASGAIYWNHAGLTGEEIARANLDGSNVDPDFIAFPKADGPTTRLVCEGIAVDAMHIYWAEYAAHAIGRANLDGSEAN